MTIVFVKNLETTAGWTNLMYNKGASMIAAAMINTSFFIT
jgi:hypothetical protein